MANGLLGGKAVNKGMIQEGTPNKMGRALSTSMIEGGFATLGGGLAKQLDNPAIGESFARQGQAVAQALRQQWWEREKQNFDAMYGQPIREQLTAAQQQYERNTKMVPLPPTPQDEAQAADPTMPPPPQRYGYRQIDPETGEPNYIPLDDPMSAAQYYNEQTKNMVGTMMDASVQYMDAAAQFPNNPMIAQSAQQLMDHVTGSFAAQQQASQMGAQQQKMQGEAQRQQQAAAQEERAAAQAQRQEELYPLKRREAEAQVETAELKNQAAEYDLEMAESRVNAKVNFGREQAAINGIDAESMSDKQAMDYYNTHIERHNEFLRKLEGAKKGGDMVPAAVGTENLGDWVMSTPEGQAFVSNGVNLATDQFLADEEIAGMVQAHVLDKIQRDLILENHETYGNMGREMMNTVKAAAYGDQAAYQQLDQLGKGLADKIIMNYKKVMKDPKARRSAGQEVINSDLDLRRQLLQAGKATAMRSVVSLSPRLKQQLNVDTYGGLNEALQAHYPEEFGQYQTDAEVFGPATRREAEVDPEITQAISGDVTNISSWLEHGATDPKVPFKKKQKIADAAIKRAQIALQHLALNQQDPDRAIDFDSYLEAASELSAMITELDAIKQGKPELQREAQEIAQQMARTRAQLEDAGDAMIESADLVDGYVHPDMEAEAEAQGLAPTRNITGIEPNEEPIDWNPLSLLPNAGRSVEESRARQAPAGRFNRRGGLIKD